MTKARLIWYAHDIGHREGLINLTRKKLCTKARIPVGSFQHVAGCTFAAFLDEVRKKHKPKKRAYHLTRARSDPFLMRGHLLDIALELAEKWGYDKITRADIAGVARVSPSLITHHFGTMDRLRFQLMQRAVKEERTKIIAQGLAGGSPTARRAPLKLRRRAAKLLAGA